MTCPLQHLSLSLVARFQSLSNWCVGTHIFIRRVIFLKIEQSYYIEMRKVRHYYSKNMFKVLVFATLICFSVLFESLCL